MLSALFNIAIGGFLAFGGFFYAGSQSDPTVSDYLLMYAGLAVFGLGVVALFVRSLRRVADWVAAALLSAYVIYLIVVFVKIKAG